MKQQAIPAGATRNRKRVGRGEANGRGKTCGRGHKGAKARSGYSLRAGFEGGQMPLFRKLPRRGFNNARFRKVFSIVNVGDLGKISGDKVDLDSVKSAGLVRRNACGSQDWPTVDSSRMRDAGCLNIRRFTGKSSTRFTTARPVSSFMGGRFMRESHTV